MPYKEKIEESIISLLGIESLSDEEKVEFLQKMTDLVQKRMVLHILEKLSPEEQVVFIDANEKNDEKKIDDILKSNNIDMLKLAEKEISKLKKELKGVIDNLD
jgi:hypothetical protein